MERTTIITPPENDEVQDSGEVPKDTAPADEPADLETEDKTDTDTSIADDSVKSEPTDAEQEPVDTDTTVSGNEPAIPSDAEPVPAPEDKPDAEVPLRTSRSRKPFLLHGRATENTPPTKTAR